MIHNWSNKPMYDLLGLINDIEKKTLIVMTGEYFFLCDLCGRQSKEGLHSESCELDKMRKIIRSLECGDD